MFFLIFVDVDLNQLKKCFGSSNEFIKSIYRNYKPYSPNNRMLADNELQKELQLLASCSYENGTKWGKEVSPVIILKGYFVEKLLETSIIVAKLSTSF